MLLLHEITSQITRLFVLLFDFLYEKLLKNK